MQNAKGKGKRLSRAVVLPLAFCILNYAYPAHAQIGRQIAEIVIEQEGRPVTDPVITGLIETHVGSPLDAREVRETIAHLMSFNRFDDVQVFSEEAGTGIRVRYVLTPLHPVDRIEFQGMLGLPEMPFFVSSSIDSVTHLGPPAPPRLSRRCEWNTGGAATRMLASALDWSRPTIRIAPP